MGHLVGKDVYRELGKKLDRLDVRVPWNAALHAILKELYSEQEADIAVKMPDSFSNLKRLEKVTGFRESTLRQAIDKMVEKGLVIDLWIKGEYHYAVSPMVIGVFEFTMMRTRGELNFKEWAKLFESYMGKDGAFFAANTAPAIIHRFRALPHPEALESLDSSESVEILDYEKASHILDSNDRFAVGICSCRHVKSHLGNACAAPLEICTSVGASADYIIRNHLGRHSSREEMYDLLAQSKELGLALTVDNVQRRPGFICHCCKCCCKVFLGLREHGVPGLVVTSNFEAEINQAKCTGCGKCLKLCPVDAIKIAPVEKMKSAPSPKKQLFVDHEICLGCGVCVTQCAFRACELRKRRQRVIHPETTFERIILQSLERGTLQNQFFDNPLEFTQKLLRGFIGGFLRLTPVKKALLSDLLRSSFLKAMRAGAKASGSGWALDL